MLKICRFLTLLIVLCTTLLPASADEDLERDFGKALDALEARDTEAFLSFWHPQSVMFTRNQLFPIEQSEFDPDDWRAFWTAIFRGVDSISYTPVDLSYRVVGDTGLVWGLATMAIDPKNGKKYVQDVRLTATLHKQGDRWMILSWHDSAFPRGPGQR